MVPDLHVASGRAGITSGLAERKLIGVFAADRNPGDVRWRVMHSGPVPDTDRFRNAGKGLSVLLSRAGYVL